MNSGTEAPTAAAKSRRDISLDIFRGLAILEVVIHHTTSFAMVRTQMGTLSHDFYAVLNRTLHFAVPAFLFIMGVLLTRTMVGKNRSWREFYTRRAQQTLWPYVLWTVLYIVFRILMGRNMTWDAMLDPSRWLAWLLWGKAWEHLYFMSLALQLYLMFPLLMGFFQRVKVGLPAVLLFTIAAQVTAHTLHGWLFRLPYPASTLLWHLIPAITGVWVGVHLDEWPQVWRWLRWVALPLMLLGWAFYLPEGYKEIHRVSTNSQLLHFSIWAYTVGVSFSLLTFCRYLARCWERPARLLQWLGTQSIQIYLVHPMILYFWALQTWGGGTMRFHSMVLMVALTALGGSLLISQAAERLGLSGFLFGRVVPRFRSTARPVLATQGE